MPVLVIPLLTTLISGFLMLVVLGRPLAWLMGPSKRADAHERQPALAVLLGVMLGLMMAFDMGGPLNKVAYAFAAAGARRRASATRRPGAKVMAAVMLAGMVPPIALALATVVRPGPVLDPRAGERQGRLAARCVLHHRGRDPVRGGRPAAGHPRDHGRQRRDRRAVDGPGRRRPRAPHGGIFVIFAVDNVLGFLIALAAGVLVAAAAVIALKSIGARDTDLATV